MPRFKFDINSIIAFEDVIGESLIKISSKPEMLVSFKALRALYWAGTDPKASLEDAGNRLNEELKNGKTLFELIDEMKKALDESCLIPEAEKQNPPETNREISG
jgi:hypothetical protein